MTVLLQDSMPLSFQILENTGKDGGVVTIRGKFQHCDMQNRNGRIYPRKVWEKHLGEGTPFMKGIQTGKVFGHQEHPQDGRSNLNLAAVKLDRLWMESDGSVMGQITTLQTPAGKTAAGLFKSGLVVGISSRGRGSVSRNGDGVDEVQEDFVPDTFDLVAEPSTPGADLTMEAFDKYMAAGALVEGEVQIPEDVKERVKRENVRAVIEARIQDLLGAKLEDKTKAAHAVHVCNDLLFDIDRFLMGESAGFVKKLQETIVSVRDSAKKIAEYGMGVSAFDRTEADPDPAGTIVDPGDPSNPSSSPAVSPEPVRSEQGDDDEEDDDEEELDDTEEGKTHDDTDDDTSTWDAWDKQFRLNTAFDAISPDEDPYDIGTQYEADGDLSHVLNVSLPFSDFSPEMREKFDIFRPGEGLEKIGDAITVAATAKDAEVLNCSGSWSEGDRITITVEFKGKPADAKAAAASVLGQTVKVESCSAKEDITATHSMLFHINPREVSSLSQEGFDTPVKLASHLRKNAGIIGEVFTVLPAVRGWFAAIHEGSIKKFKKWAQDLGFRFNEAVLSIGDRDMVGSRLSESVLKLIEGLRDRNMALQAENDRLVLENSNVRELNEAMTALYKVEKMERHHKDLLERYPILQKANIVLTRAQTVEELDEKASIFLGIHGQKLEPVATKINPGKETAAPESQTNRRSATQSSSQVSEGVPQPGNNGAKTLTESTEPEASSLFGDADDIGSRMRRSYTSKG